MVTIRYLNVPYIYAQDIMQRYTIMFQCYRTHSICGIALPDGIAFIYVCCSAKVHCTLLDSFFGATMFQLQWLMMLYESNGCLLLSVLGRHCYDCGLFLIATAFHIAN